MIDKYLLFIYNKQMLVAYPPADKYAVNLCGKKGRLKWKKKLYLLITA